MEAFLKDIVKLDMYVDVTCTRLDNSGAYIDSADLDVYKIVRKDLASIVHKNLLKVMSKGGVELPPNELIDEEKYSNMLLQIKKQLFIRCKEIGKIDNLNKKIEI